MRIELNINIEDYLLINDWLDNIFAYEGVIYNQNKINSIVNKFVKDYNIVDNNIKFDTFYKYVMNNVTNKDICDSYY